MNGIGYTQKNIIEPNLHGYINVAMFSDKGVQLDGSNLMECITRAHEAGYSSYFIPSGYYLNPKCDINWDCRITCDKESLFEIDADSEDFKHIFQFTMCSVELNGGTYKSGTFVFDHNDGTDDIGTVGREFLFINPNPSKPSTHPEWEYTNTHIQSSFIRYIACHDCKTSNIYVPYSNIGGIISQVNCRNMVVINCKFLNYLEQAVGVSQSRGNTITSSSGYYNNCYSFEVSNCIFKNAMLATNSYSGRYDADGDGVDEAPQPHQWCYGTATGVSGNPKSLTAELDTWEKVCNASIRPLSNLIYRNNYMDGSEDCGLDTHGASNVIIENNTILNTVCAITAYEDNRREPRPLDWSMHNILIQNNYCYSLKSPMEGTNYPHGFIFLGPSCLGPLQKCEWNSLMKQIAYSNLTVRNNVFRTGHRGLSGNRGWLDMDMGGSGAIFENNQFESIAVSGVTQITSFIEFYSWENVIFKNNRNIGTNVLRVNLWQSDVTMENNIRIQLTEHSTLQVNYIQSNIPWGIYPVFSSPLVKLGDIRSGFDANSGPVAYLPSNNTTGVYVGMGLMAVNLHKDGDGTITNYSIEMPNTVEITGSTMEAKYPDAQTGTMKYYELLVSWNDVYVRVTNVSNGKYRDTLIKRKQNNCTLILNNSTYSDGTTMSGTHTLKVLPAYLKYLKTYEDVPRSTSTPPAD